MDEVELPDKGRPESKDLPEDQVERDIWNGDGPDGLFQAIEQGHGSVLGQGFGEFGDQNRNHREWKGLRDRRQNQNGTLPVREIQFVTW